MFWMGVFYLLAYFPKQRRHDRVGVLTSPFANYPVFQECSKSHCRQLSSAVASRRRDMCKPCFPGLLEIPLSSVVVSCRQPSPGHV